MKHIDINVVITVTDENGVVVMRDETDAIAVVEKVKRGAMKTAAIEANERTIDAVIRAALGAA